MPDRVLQTTAPLAPGEIAHIHDTIESLQEKLRVTAARSWRRHKMLRQLQKALIAQRHILDQQAETIAQLQTANLHLRNRLDGAALP